MSDLVPKDATKTFDGILFNIYQWDLDLYDGTRARYECAVRQDSASVIAFKDPDTIVLTEQEQPNRAKPFIDVPGGRVDEGEEPEQTARREFLEETGMSIGRLIPYKQIQLSGSTRFTLHYYLATDLEEVAGAQHPDPGERITVRYTPIDEAVRMSLQQEMRQAWVMLAILSFAYDPKSKKILEYFLAEKHVAP